MDINSSEQRPESPLEALMQATPFQDAQESVEELQIFRDAVADCIDKLPKKYRNVVDAINSEMLSLRELGVRLGIHNVAAMRLRDKAYTRLRVLMENNEVIRERLQLDE